MLTGDRDGRGYDRIERDWKPAGLVRFQVGMMMDPRGRSKIVISLHGRAHAVKRTKVEKKTQREGRNRPISQRRTGCFLGFVRFNL